MFAPTGVAFVALVVTVALTPLVSLLVLRRFRQAVARSMRATVAVPAPSPGAMSPGAVGGMAPTAAVELVELSRHSSVRGPLRTRAARQVGRALGWQLVAGVMYAATQSAILYPVLGQGYLVPRTVLIGLLLLWPVVPALVVLAAPARWVKVSVAAAYAVVVLVVGVFAGASASTTIQVWAIQEGPATLALLLIAGRRLRAVGPIVAPAVFVVGMTPLVASWTAASARSEGLPSLLGWLLAPFVIPAVVGAALLIVVAAAQRYRRRIASDQSVLLDQWWLYFALWHFLLVVPTAGWPALFLLMPYGAYRLTARFGRWRSYRRAIRQSPTRLLLLRVFGARGRSERLLRDVGAYWRYVGSVQLIAGTDLATETLEPHEFLDFTLGTVSRRFVTTDAEIAQRAQQLELRPDADGRFRVNEFFCHDDTWRPMLRALLRSTDAVLVDLRGMDLGHQGVAYELHQLVLLGVIDRVVALVDRTTDRSFLLRTLAAASAEPTAAPTRLRVMDVRGRRAETRELLRHLGAVSASAAA